MEPTEDYFIIMKIIFMILDCVDASAAGLLRRLRKLFMFHKTFNNRSQNRYQDSRDDEKRPDGLTVLPWANGRCLVWDFTCSDTMAASHLNRAVVSG